MIPKFRAWHKEKKQMFDVAALFFSRDGRMNVGNFVAGCFVEHYKSDDVKLMQSTGLKDKNGKEIFTGDIVKVQTTSIIDGSKLDFLAYVYFNEEYLAFLIKNLNPIGDFASAKLQEYLKQNREIIGNIHENPEIMAEVKNDA